MTPKSLRRSLSSFLRRVKTGKHDILTEFKVIGGKTLLAERKSAVTCMND